MGEGAASRLAALGQQHGDSDCRVNNRLQSQFWRERGCGGGPAKEEVDEGEDRGKEQLLPASASAAKRSWWMRPPPPPPPPPPEVETTTTDDDRRPLCLSPQHQTGGGRTKDKFSRVLLLASGRRDSSSSSTLARPRRKERGSEAGGGDGGQEGEDLAAAKPRLFRLSSCWECVFAGYKMLSPASTCTGTIWKYYEKLKDATSERKP